jgi:hypothetical protein
MTDFMPESAWAPSTRHGPDFRESTCPAPVQELASAPPPRRAVRRPAAALAADMHALLESMARKRVPRLDALRRRLRSARADLAAAPLAQGLDALRAATTALDFLAGRSGGERAADFLRQGTAFTAAARGLSDLATAFGERQAIAVPVARLVWIELVLQSGSLHRHVQQGARWLAEMDRDLQQRRPLAGSAVASAIDALARRGQAMRERLQAVHRLCGHARRAHALCEQLAGEWAALGAALQSRVLPACRSLTEALQPLLEAASYRALVPEELIAVIDARHALQVELTQAGARLSALDADEQELACELAAMEEKAAQFA